MRFDVFELHLNEEEMRNLLVCSQLSIEQNWLSDKNRGHHNREKRDPY
jgi:hypothetical protein